MTATRFPAQPGRLDATVAAHLGVARADVVRAIERGLVTVDGARRPKSHRLAGGEMIEAELARVEELEPDPAPIRILFEDDHLLVVSKPAGLLTHPTATRRTGTLVNRLLALGIPLAEAGGEGRPGIVHRLDAGTSGAMVVAKDDATHAALKALFRKHLVDRRYLALVRGAVGPSTFRVDAPLERRRARIRVGSPSGREATTDALVRERLPEATLLEVRPRTGRTHQIRVHLSTIGHPVLGDAAYGGGGDQAKRLGLTRPFLHSWRIAFDHPVAGRRVELEDRLPPDLEEAVERARAAS